ncbi:hypothetical protein [Paenirhodobacter sp.]|uniref:hypothetical protein n=1 Tax=Paenirhodobacter sp. TaxID=1965326 RepID=UPI003B3CBD3A
MQVAFHLGAYSTDADQLVRTLHENDRLLRRRGICLPDPIAFRGVLRDTLTALQGQPASAETSSALCDALAVEQADDLRRLVLSHGNFLAQPERIITAEGLYPLAAERIGPLANLFPDAQTEFHFALINPALLVMALVTRQHRRSYDEIMAGLSPTDLTWTPVVARMVEAAQGRRLTIWCNEDMPLILPEVVRAMAGLAATDPLAGEFGMLEQIMTPEGLTRLRDYLASRPPHSVAQRRKVVTAFLESYSLPDARELDLPLPGWTDELVEDITQGYDADVARIAAMPGVTFLHP